MMLHGNARSCPNSRRLLVERVNEQGWSVTAAAEAAGVSERTVYRWLKRWRERGRAGLCDRSSRPRRSPLARARSALTPSEPDTIRVHVMIDDRSRLGYAEVLPTLRTRCAIDFLRCAIAWLAERGVAIKAVMSDNGSAYVSHPYREALAELNLRHLRIQPYRPRTNGKAERFIQTLLNEWAYQRIFGSSAERTAALPLFLERYNFSDHTAHSATDSPRQG